MARLTVESKQSRTIVGQLGCGEDLVGGLIAVGTENGVRCASVRVTGTLEELVLADLRPGRPPRHYLGQMQLLSASGTLSEREGKAELNLPVVVARQQDVGVSLIGGICVSAMMITCEFVIEALDDVILRRGIDTSGRDIWIDAISASQPPAEEAPAARAPAPRARNPFVDGMERAKLPPKPGKPSWADAVMASVKSDGAEPPPEEEEEVHLVEPGDILDHQKFGRCLVQKVNADGEYASVRLKNGRLVRLNLDVLKISLMEEDAGTARVFKVSPYME